MRLHRLAMEQSDLALLARAKGDKEAAQIHFQSAYELESQAANALRDNFGAEPTRSVLFRSAASLAIDCGRLTDAKKLIYTALAGKPPAEIAEELHELLDVKQ